MPNNTSCRAFLSSTGRCPEADPKQWSLDWRSFAELPGYSQSCEVPWLCPGAISFAPWCWTHSLPLPYPPRERLRSCDPDKVKRLLPPSRYLHYTSSDQSTILAWAGFGVEQAGRSLASTWDGWLRASTSWESVGSPETKGQRGSVDNTFRSSIPTSLQKSECNIRFGHLPLIDPCVQEILSEGRRRIVHWTPDFDQTCEMKLVMASAYAFIYVTHNHSG